LWLGVAAHEGGFDTLFMYSWRDRETVMDILENLSGNRVNYSATSWVGLNMMLTKSRLTKFAKGSDFLERTRPLLSQRGYHG